MDDEELRPHSCPVLEGLAQRGHPAASGLSASHRGGGRVTNFRRSILVGLVSTVTLSACSGAPDYFPPGQIDSFRDEWYSEQLRAAMEPALEPTGSVTRAAFRFTWIPSFTPTLTVRVVRSDARITLVAKRLSGAGGYEPGRVRRQVRFALSTQQWSELSSLIDAADFWAMPSEEPEKCDASGACWVGMDGAQWLLEGADSTRYHFVDRWFHEDYPEFEAACFCLLQWSGLVTEAELTAYLGERRPSPDCTQTSARLTSRARGARNGSGSPPAL